jgi:DNA modification methylase
MIELMQGDCLDKMQAIPAGSVDMVLADQALDPSDHKRLDAAQGKRWHAIARTDIETGFMALVRSIAQPQPRD